MQQEESYEIGLALSGGFIKGFAHLGAVQALFEAGIRPGIISGVSAGALAGVFLADGKEPYEILELFNDKEFGDFTRFSFRSRGGFMLLDHLYDFLYGNLSVRRIEELRLPIIITATNLDRGVAAHFREGDIAPCVAASCCVPGLFAPIEIDGDKYVDGGVFMNLPVSVIRHSCEKVVAVNVSPLSNHDYKNNVLGVLWRTYDLMSHSNAFLERRMADILIEPEDLYGYGNRELHKAGEIFKSGYDTARIVLDQVKDIVFPGNEG